MMLEDITRSLVAIGFDDAVSETVITLIMAVIVILLCLLADFAAKKVILKLVVNLAKKNKYQWDDIIIKHKAFHRIARVTAPLLAIIFSSQFPDYEVWIRRFATAYIVFIFLLVIDSLLKVADEIYRTFEVSKTRPIKGLLQVVKIVAFIVGAVIIISTLIGKSPAILLGGFGALSAVLLLVFQSSILGFVAGIQLISNDLIRIGDWIQMPKYDANGTVIDLTLTTVKVQNFDRSITSIPANALMSDSFRNWRGMKMAGVRRFIRAISIDINSISFCDDDAHSTNVEAFRTYIFDYLKNHPGLNKDMTVMVRQLDPSPNGLPIEIYGFANTTEWVEFEKIQAGIIDHMLAALPQFGLRAFQNPTGHDVASLRK
ncbi:MAG: mechanosensitive ion channel family protein [Acetivibrionales bacterium]|jgi:miniconductance mechanosensitive channel